MTTFIDISSVVLTRGMLHPTTYIQRINNKINENNLSLSFDGFIGEWNGCDTKIQFTCSEHGIWNSCTIDNFVNKKTNCPYCSGNGYKLDIEEEISNIKEVLSSESKYSFVDIHEINGKDSKLILECTEHGTWNTCTINNFKHGNRCPECGNKNLKTTVSSDDLYFYVIVWNDIIKYGVSTNVERRINDIKYKTKMDFKLVESFKVSSNDIEKHLKEMDFHSYTTKFEFGNGYTETVCIDEYDNFMDEVQKFK